MLVLPCSFFAMAEPSNFTAGPVFEDNGEHVVVDNGLINAKQQDFKVVFDIAKINDKMK